jgi:tagatose-6-phosphate ketose/aldose isomerase
MKMQYLGHSDKSLEAAGGIWTAREISQQASVWSKIERIMDGDAAGLRGFLDPLLKRRDLRIVLTGAGTSAFVGECLAPALKGRTRLRVDAVPSTDLISSPDAWLTADIPTLLVSFARSGNSPESIEALHVADQIVRECHHLIVTCNREGALFAQGSGRRNAHVVLLPDESNDRGFAMTSSFTGMLLAAATAFDLLSRQDASHLGAWANAILERHLPLIEQLVASSVERVVYLGDRELKGLAREAALKLLELSDGKVVALAETPLGFRHGPKTIVNDKTLIVMFLGNDPHASQYEKDVLTELRSDGVAARVVALHAGALIGASSDALALTGAAHASGLALCFPYVVFAQAFAFLKSLALGLRPDTPNARGVVNRVVQGVSVYPWNPTP